MTSHVEEPLVTIALPVRNGGRAFVDAVGDLLAQSEPRLRLIISDNASTDGTAEAALRFAKEDARVEVLHQTCDIGPVANFNLLADLAVRRADTPYFAWAAHDDRWEPDFLQASIGLLEDAPEAAGAIVGIEVCGERGQTDFTWRPPRALASVDVVDRIRAIRGTPWWHGVYGVHRLAVLEEGGRYAPVWNGDGLFVFTALLRRPYAVTERVLRHYNVSDTKAKAQGDHRSIRVDRPGDLQRAMRTALSAAPDLTEAQRRAIGTEITRIRWHLERATRAYAARRETLEAIERRRWLVAGMDGVAAMALAPVRTGRSVADRLRRRG